MVKLYVYWVHIKRNYVKFKFKLKIQNEMGNFVEIHITQGR